MKIWTSNNLWTQKKNKTYIYIYILHKTLFLSQITRKWWKANNPAPPGLECVCQKEKSPPAGFSLFGCERTIQMLSMMQRCWTLLPSGPSLNFARLLGGERLETNLMDLYHCSRVQWLLEDCDDPALTRPSCSRARSEQERDGAMSPSAATCCNWLMLNVGEVLQIVLHVNCREF